MKKFTILFVCCLISCIVSGQTEKGNYTMGLSVFDGRLGSYVTELRPNNFTLFSTYKTEFGGEQVRAIHVALRHSAGYFLMDGLLLNLNVNLLLHSFKYTEVDYTPFRSTFFSAGPEIRYIYGQKKFRPMAGAFLNIGTNRFNEPVNTEEGIPFDKISSNAYGGYIGYGFFPEKRYSINLSLMYITNTDRIKDIPNLSITLNITSLQVGFNYYFHKLK
jgi:hypothetical protein